MSPKSWLRERLKAKVVDWSTKDHDHGEAGSHLLRVALPSQADIRVIRFSQDEHPDHVTVGRYCSLNWRSFALVGGEHRSTDVTTFNIAEQILGKSTPGLPGTKGPIVIGNDVLVSYEAMIMSGVKIGDGAIVGARALVTKDVPPYAIVGGNPARIIRFRFDQPTIEALLRIKWWDWPDEMVIANAEVLNGGNLAAFVAAHDPGK